MRAMREGLMIRAPTQEFTSCPLRTDHLPRRSSTRTERIIFGPHQPRLLLPSSRTVDSKYQALVLLLETGGTRQKYGTKGGK